MSMSTEIRRGLKFSISESDIRDFSACVWNLCELKVRGVHVRSCDSVGWGGSENVVGSVIRKSATG